jgi:beta-barrel assembly-enhancing protease
MEAKFFDGRSAQRHSVNIDILSDRVVFRKVKDEGAYDWFFRDLEGEKISETVLIVRNRLIPDARLEIEGGPAVRSIQSKLRFRPSVIWTEDTRVLLWVFGGFLLVALAVFSSMDKIAEAAVTFIPRKLEKQIFGDYAKVLGATACNDKEASKVIDQLTTKLTSAEEFQEFKVIIVKNDLVNAFAIPGGTILIHSQLIKEVHHSDEIAGVLAHEIEHQAQRHIAKALVKTSLLTVAGSFVVGGKMGDLAATLAQLKFSRDTEGLADKGAAERLDRAGISRVGLINFLKRLSKMTAIPQFISTHPLEGREDQLLDNYDQAKKRPPSLSDAEFKRLKALKCEH